MSRVELGHCPLTDEHLISNGKETIAIPRWAYNAILDVFETQTMPLRKLLYYVAPIAWGAATNREREQMEKLGIRSYL